jgi:hypothetical protein
MKKSDSANVDILLTPHLLSALKTQQQNLEAPRRCGGCINIPEAQAN